MSQSNGREGDNGMTRTRDYSADKPKTPKKTKDGLIIWERVEDSISEVGSAFLEVFGIDADSKSEIKQKKRDAEIAADLAKEEEITKRQEAEAQARALAEVARATGGGGNTASASSSSMLPLVGIVGLALVGFVATRK